MTRREAKGNVIKGGQVRGGRVERARLAGKSNVSDFGEISVRNGEIFEEREERKEIARNYKGWDDR